MAKGSLIKALLVIAVLGALLYFMTQKSKYEMFPSAPLVNQQQEPVMEMRPVPVQTVVASSDQGQMLGGVSSGLLPKEPVGEEDFGSFSADAILSGQNFLDPRAQIGYPETVGGTLRNANLQLRSEPSNPRDPVSIFNLSTIVPDNMRPEFEIGKI